MKTTIFSTLALLLAFTASDAHSGDAKSMRIQLGDYGVLKDGIYEIGMRGHDYKVLDVEVGAQLSTARQGHRLKGKCSDTVWSMEAIFDGGPYRVPYRRFVEDAVEASYDAPSRTITMPDVLGDLARAEDAFNQDLHEACSVAGGLLIEVKMETAKGKIVYGRIDLDRRGEDSFMTFDIKPVFKKFWYSKKIFMTSGGPRVMVRVQKGAKLNFLAHSRRIR